MNRILSVVIVAVCAALAASPELAQGRLASPFARPGYGVPVDAEPTPYSFGGSCIRMCANDNTPCDPESYKVADRRCNFNQSGPGTIPGTLFGPGAAFD